MGEEKRVEKLWSQVATAEDIYRRLVRPSALRSQPPTAKEEEKTKTNRKRKKLEDYLDPALLLEISAKISGAKKIPVMKKPIMEEMVNKDLESSTSVDLKGNTDPIYQYDGAEEEEEASSSSFRHFEQMALTRFKDS